MVCLMELSSHLLCASMRGQYDVNEMQLAAGLTKQAPNNYVKLFDWGIYSTSPLQDWWQPSRIVAAEERYSV